MPSFKIIGILVLENRIFQVFFTYKCIWSSSLLGHMTWTIYAIIVPPSKGGSIQNLALTDQVVLEMNMFENNGHLHVFSPGAGADDPLGSNFFYKHKSLFNLVISCKFFSLNGLVKVFPFQTHMQPN